MKARSPPALIPFRHAIVKWNTASRYRILNWTSFKNSLVAPYMEHILKIRGASVLLGITRQGNLAPPKLWHMFRPRPLESGYSRKKVVFFLRFHFRPHVNGVFAHHERRFLKAIFEGEKEGFWDSTMTSEARDTIWSACERMPCTKVSVSNHLNVFVWTGKYDSKMLCVDVDVFK